MELGTYVDGRPLNYDETTKQFAIGEAPVTYEQVVGYDRVGQVAWASDEARTQALGFAGVAKVKPLKPEPSGKGLFGFRSRQPWKIVVASLYYVLAALMGIGVMATRKSYATSGTDIAVEVLSGLFLTLALLSPAFLLSDFGYRDRLPIFKRRHIGWSALGLVLFFMLMAVTSALADGLHTQPYKVAAAAEKAAQDREATKKTQAEADATKAAAAKQQAEAEAKRAAEASAAAEAKRVAEEKKAAEASAAAAAQMTAPVPAPTPKPAPVAAPKPETADAYLRKVVTDELGDKTNMGDKPKIRGIEESGGKAYWLVSLNGNENLTNNMTKEGMWLNTKDVWQRVFSERKDIDEVIIRWFFPLVDAKGNTSDERVMELVMTKKNAADVHWENVLLKNIPVIADDYWESPVFSN